MSDKKLFFGFLLLVAVLTMLSVYIVNLYNSKNYVIDLEGVEIREYEEKGLSWINEFHENSLHGPQYIDNETYRLVIKGLVDDQLEYTYARAQSLNNDADLR